MKKLNYFGLISALLMIISVFLPWKAISFSTHINVSGFNMNSAAQSQGINGLYYTVSYLAIILGLIGGFLSYRNFKIAFVIGIVNLVIGICCAFDWFSPGGVDVGLLNFQGGSNGSDISSQMKMKTQLGLYLFILSSLSFTVAGVVSLLNTSKSSSQNNSSNINVKKVTVIISIAILLLGLGGAIFYFYTKANKVDKICECLKKTANAYMIKGEKIAEDKIVHNLCSQYEDELKDANIDDKTRIESCIDTVKEHIEDKVLFTDIEQLSFPLIPCGQQFFEDLKNVENKNSLDKANALFYFLKNRDLSCSLVVLTAKKESGECIVSGQLYSQGKIEGSIRLALPESELAKIIPAKDSVIQTGSGLSLGDFHRYHSYRQIIDFTGQIYNVETYNLNIANSYFFKAKQYKFKSPDVNVDKGMRDGVPLFIYGNSENTVGMNEEEKLSSSLTNDESASDEVDLSSDLKGSWSGQFGKDVLTINIEFIDHDGNVKGFDEVKGNRRTLSGTKTGNLFELHEPGDDKWDGIFTFEYNQSSNTFIGQWKANNGKSIKQFTLNKN